MLTNPLVNPLTSILSNPLSTLGSRASLPIFNSAIASVLAGTDDARVLCIGDSTTFGAWSTNTNVGEQVINNYPTQLASLLRRNGITANTNSFMGAGTVGETIISGGDSRVVLGAGWGRESTGSTNYTLGGVSFINNTDTTAISFTPTTQCDTFTVYYTRQTGTSSFNLDINGTGTTLVNVSFSSSAVGVATISGSLGNNTLNISRVSGTIRIIGVIARNSAQKEISVINAGWSSGFASYIADETFNFDRPYRPLAMIDLLAPKLVILNFGINEASASFNLANFKTLITTIVTRSKSIGADVLLYTSNPHKSGGTPRNNQIAYMNVLREVAAENSVPLVDIWSRWVSSVISYNWFGDTTVHPNMTGYQDIANQLGNTILASYRGAAPAPFNPNSIGGLRFWGDTRYLENLSVVASASVTQWNDLSGNGYNATVTVAGRRPNITSYLGVTGILFNSANTTQLNLFYSNFYQTANGPNTAFFVIAPTSAGTDLRLFGGRGDLAAATSTHTWRFTAIPASSAFTYQQRTSAGVASTRVSTTAALINNWGIIVSRFDGTSTTLWYNGVVRADGAGEAVQIVSAQFGAGGADSPGYDGYLNQSVIYASALTSAQINTVCNNLLAPGANITWTSL